MPFSWHSKSVVRFYNKRGTAEQWIKEGKIAMTWTRLSCHAFRDNEVRLQLFALAYNLGNFLRRLALPRKIKHWTLTTLREKLIKIGAKVIRHARYITFQLAEVAVQKPFWIYFAKDWPFAAFAGDGISIDKKESWNKNKRIGSSKKARLTWILHWKDANVDQEGKKWETQEQIPGANPMKNFYPNRRFALSGLISTNFNVHMGNLGLY